MQESVKSLQNLVNMFTVYQFMCIFLARIGELINKTPRTRKIDNAIVKMLTAAILICFKTT